jgi:hypothetical protein
MSEELKPSVLETRNDEAGFVEYVNSDVPYIVRDLASPAAVLLDVGTRAVIGYRVYDPAAARPAPTVEPVAVKALDDINPMAVAETGFGTWAAKPHNVKWVRLIAGTPIENDLIVNMANAIRATTTALVADRDEARKQLAAVTAERDRAQKACEQIAKRFTPRRLRYAPKDRLIIGVERPPYEEETYFYDLLWSDDKQCFLTPTVGAFNGASHFLDPRDLIGLPPQERLSREDRKKATARAALTGGEDAN